MTDSYDFWREALAGNKPQMSEGTPMPGYYRWPKKSSYGARKTFQSIAYWPENDVMLCEIDGTLSTPQYGADIWISVGAHPVSYEDYTAYLENGKWADEHALVSMGSNQAPDDDSYEGLKSKIEELARDANKLIVDDKVAQTQAEVDQLSNLADRLAELGQRAEGKRKAEKKPHDDAANAVQEKWRPLVITSEVYKGIKNRLILPFLSAQEKAAKQAREILQGGGLTELEEIAALKIAEAKPRAGTRGRAMSLRGTKKARIIDRDAVLAHFKDNEMVSTALQVLSDRAVKAGESVPGVEAFFEERVT